MRFFTVVTVIIVLVLMSFFYVVPKKAYKFYSDDELRETALSRNMSSIPDTYEKLLKLVDTPENRLSKDKIALGKDLFFDKILSKDRDMNCATCHMISENLNDKKLFISALTSEPNTNKDCAVCHLSDQSATDRRSTAIGHNQQENPSHLNTLTILNSALAKYQTWSGEVDTVEAQTGRSILDPYQMNMMVTKVEKRLREESSYVEKFNKAFKTDKNSVTFENVQKAIGTYLRTLLTRSDYDRFLEGDNSAMSKKAKKGLANFINFGCKGCHTGITVGGQSIQKFPLRDYNSILDITSTLNEEINGREIGGFGFNFSMYHHFPFENKGQFMGRRGEQLFRVPMLRNVTKTSPYFHNGSIQKIREVVYIMAKHQLGMNLTNNQIDEIVAFLNSLEGTIVDYEISDKAEL